MAVGAADLTQCAGVLARTVLRAACARQAIVAADFTEGAGITARTRPFIAGAGRVVHAAELALLTLRIARAVAQVLDADGQPVRAADTALGAAGGTHGVRVK